MVNCNSLQIHFILPGLQLTEPHPRGSARTLKQIINCLGRWGRVPLHSEKKCKKSGKRGGNREKWENIGKTGKIGKKRQNPGSLGSFTLPLLTDRAGYPIDESHGCMYKDYDKIHVKATIMCFKNEIKHTYQISTMCVHYQSCFIVYQI